MSRELERLLDGSAAQAVERFYARLPELPRAERPSLLVGMGYNFESYDCLFALMAAHLQTALDDTDYTRRYRSLQALLQPFCSEYGIEAGRPLGRTHRELYAEFFRGATGQDFPERYLDPSGNPWLALSRRWAERMARTIACPADGPAFRARFNVGYHWAVERLSVIEFEAMRRAWGSAGVRAAYLDVHCEVEGEHARWAERAVTSLAPTDDPAVARGVKAHERELAGYYRELLSLSEPVPAASGAVSDRRA